MHFASWQEFFNMGDYGLYVWPSFILTLVVLGIVMLSPLFRHRQLLREQSRQQRLQQTQEPTP